MGKWGRELGLGSDNFAVFVQHIGGNVQCGAGHLELEERRKLEAGREASPWGWVVKPWGQVLGERLYQIKGVGTCETI